MKLNSKIFSKSLVLETKQMEAIKGGASYTQDGQCTDATGATFRDWKGDGTTTGTWCHVADKKYPGGDIPL